MMICRRNNQQGRFVAGLFGAITPFYDILNTVFSFGLDGLWRRHLVRCLADRVACQGALLVDLAAGTMKVTSLLTDLYPASRILALDFCRPMLEKGWQAFKKRQTAVPVLPLVADALQLPLPHCSVDALTLAFGLRNMQPRRQVLDEIYRVLKPGGKVAILEFGSTQDPILFGVYAFYLEKLMPGIAKLFFKNKEAYQYLARSIAAYPSAASIQGELEKAGFSSVRYRPLSWGIVYLHEGVKDKRVAAFR